MKLSKYKVKWQTRKDIKDWKKYKYEDSIDFLMAEIVANITTFNKQDINIWYAKRDKSNNFSNFKFEYHGKYYELINKELKEIDASEIFSK